MKKNRIKPKRRELSVSERDRLAGKIGAVTPSAPWTEAVASDAERAGLHPAGHHLRADLHRLGIFPPADPTPRRPQRRRETLMKQCTECGGKWYPPQYVANGSSPRLERKLARLIDQDAKNDWAILGSTPVERPALVAVALRLEAEVRVTRELLESIRATRVCADCCEVLKLRPHEHNLDYAYFVSTESRSAEAIQELERRGEVLQEPSVQDKRVRQKAMPSAEEGDLLEEIRLFHESGYVVEVYRNRTRNERRAVYVARDEGKLAAIRREQHDAADAEQLTAADAAMLERVLDPTTDAGRPRLRTAAT